MNKLLLKTSVAISSLPVAAFALAGRVFADCRTEGCAATGFSCQQIGTSDQWGCFDSGNFQPTKGFFTSFETLWSRLLQFVMAIGLLMVFLYLIWGGIDWITSGGDKENPTYEDVCDGQTNHAEVIKIEFDAEKINYEELLRIFWTNHDPTEVNRQGPDVGKQYRTTIFYISKNQKKKCVEKFTGFIFF